MSVGQVYRRPHEKPFAEVWCFPTEVKQKLGAAWFDIRPKQNPVGKAAYEVLFMDNKDVVLDIRPAMKLVSKKTNRDYYVCHRESALLARTVLARSLTGNFDE